MLLGARRHLLVALTSAIGALSLAVLAEVVIARMLPPTKVSASCAEPTVLMVVLDRSGSMSGSMIEGSALNRLQRVQESASRFVARAREDPCFVHMRVGLVTFAWDPTLDVPPTGDLDAFEAAVRAVVAQHGTRVELGIATAVEAVAGAAYDGWRKVLYLLTDANNENSDAVRLELGLRAALDAGVDVRAVLTEELPYGFVYRDVLGNANVISVDDVSMGDTFLSELEQTLFPASVIAPERHYLATVLWTAMVTAGVALALLLYLNLFNRRKVLFSPRDALAVVGALLLGLAIGAVAQFLPSLPVVADFWTESGPGERRLVGDLLVWSLIGLLLTTGLAAFRILPNRRILNAMAFGLLGGLAAGFVYGAVIDMNVVDSQAYLPRLVAAAALGATIGFAFNLFSETSTQYPLWLRVHYLSDKVYRYHPIGATPLTVGAGRNADVYVPGDRDVVWRFSVKGQDVVIENIAAGRTRSLPRDEVALRGSIELLGLTLRIVDDVGPQKGRSS